MNLKCQKCHKATVRIGVNLFLDIPAYFYSKLSKKNLRSKETHVKGAGWDRAYFYCNRPNCGWSTHLLEVDTLRKENTELKEKIFQIAKKCP